ncbi:MAG: RNA polymerase sigma factor [Chloroflexota bacterium]
MNISMDEAALVNSLRSGDECAFVWLVEQYHTSLVRLARMFVQDEPTAEELVQETWLAVLRGLEKFESRSSLKTWIFTILTNKAKTRSQREKRSVSFSDLDDPASDSPTVDPKRFNDSTAEKSPDHWAADSKPGSWRGISEDTLISQETMDLINRAISELPETQRAVITLRDIHELSSDEVCNVLGVSETNQRVLLHRARAKVRQALENYLQLEH